MTTAVEQHHGSGLDHGPQRPVHGWHRLTAPGWLRAAWMTPLFFGIGFGIVVFCRWIAHYDPLVDWTVITERRRTDRTMRAADLAIAAALFADGLLLAATKPLWGVLTMALAVGIALASLLMEPSTTEAAFGRG